MSLKKCFLAIAIAASAVFFVWGYYNELPRVSYKEKESCPFGNLGKKPILIREARFEVYSAETPAARRCGLSRRVSIPVDGGMIFIFETEGKHSIWMKEMQFPIDALWLDSGRNIIAIETDADPSSFPTVFTPEKNARYILELPSGAVEKYGILHGDEVFFVDE